MRFISHSTPSFTLPHDNVSKETKSHWLLEICENLVQKQLFWTGEIEALVEKTGSLQGALEGPFQCRQKGFNKVYVQHSRRVQ